VTADDEPGSLALITAVATFALAFAAILTIDQSATLVQAAVDEAKAPRETVESSSTAARCNGSSRTAAKHYARQEPSILNLLNLVAIS